jgi:methyltransferase family protein
MEIATLTRALNNALSPLGIRIARTTPSHNWNDPTQFLPLEETLSGARSSGLSVGDYVDVTYNAAGATQDTIDRMDEMGVFAGPIGTVVEVGPGSGRYLEKVASSCSPKRYEIYETSNAWAEYLVRTYGVVRQPVDGKSLAATATRCVDLVQAHKVFCVTTFVTTCQYWREMLRVVRPNGFIVFDIVTEACMDEPTLEHWIDAGFTVGNYPAVVPRQYAVEFFRRAGASMVGSFFIPMKPGTTEVFVFRKLAS